MKKKFILSTLLIMIVTLGWSSNSEKTELSPSDLALENITALTQNITPRSTCHWATRDASEKEVICIVTGAGYECACGAVKPGHSTE
ncbi:hypothetical protein ACGE0T_16660 [Parabacteroides sp. APC149_11_2_Y6]